MLTGGHLAAMVGRTGWARLRQASGTLRLAVRVLDSKVAYGRVRLLVEPLDKRSEGRVWCWGEHVVLTDFEKQGRV